VSAAESVDDLAQLEQVGEPTKAGHRHAIIAGRGAAGTTFAPVGPHCRHQRAAAVGQADEQVQDSVSPHAADHRQAPAFQSMALSDDRHRIWSFLAMGSLSPLPSTRSRITT
jgi:hypothetical protein